MYYTNREDWLAAIRPHLDITERRAFWDLPDKKLMPDEVSRMPYVVIKEFMPAGLDIDAKREWWENVYITTYFDWMKEYARAGISGITDAPQTWPWIRKMMVIETFVRESTPLSCPF